MEKFKNLPFVFTLALFLMTVIAVGIFSHRFTVNKVKEYEERIKNIHAEYQMYDSVRTILENRNREINALYDVIHSFENKRNEEENKLVEKIDSIRTMPDSIKLQFLADRYNLFAD